MPDQREVLESPLDQGALEALAYQFDFAGAGVVTIVGTPAVKVVRSDGIDVSASTMPTTVGTAAGLVVTTPIVSALDAGKNYRLYCRVTHDGSQVTELFCTLKAKP